MDLWVLSLRTPCFIGFVEGVGSFSEEKRRQRFFTDMNFDLWVFIVESLKAGNSHIFLLLVEYYLNLCE